MNDRARYRKIVVPLDGSGWSQRAVPHAIDIARASGAEVILLHIFRPPGREYLDSITLGGGDSQIQQLREQAKQYLIGLRTELRQEKCTVRTQFIEGADVPTMICEYVRNEGADLVVMSTHGRSGLSRLVFGSVAQATMECLDVPVLLVKPDQELP
ncbi:universal stress protein [Anaerolineae bacterium CFX9]|jgi:nucleotide-binding universal stress UspA family protein|nr:universal stress protein [Anaerolineae bacterium CFX9]